MSAPTVQELDELCTRMYSAAEVPQRTEAQAQLETLTNHDGNLDGTIYMTILQASTNQYTLLFCAQSVVVWFKANAKRFNSATQGDIVLAIVDASKRLKQCNVPRHIVSAIVASAAKVSKLGCEKEPCLLAGILEALRMIESEVPSAANAAASLSVSAPAVASPNTPPGGALEVLTTNDRSNPPLPLPPAPRGFYLGLGLQLLNAFVTEFNLYDSSKQQSFMNFATHRRCSNNFKDAILLRIFFTSLCCLEAVDAAAANEGTQMRSAANAASVNPGGPLDGTAAACVADIVLLVKNVLTYDFMAIIVDETEDALSAQFPTVWKEALLSQKCLEVLWGQHARLHYPHCANLLAGVSSICGIRRSFFDTVEEKVQFLDFTMTQVCLVETVPDDRLKNMHYCSVLAECINKFVSPFGYRDLSSSPSFERWVRFAEKLSSGVFTTVFGQDGTFTTTTTLLQFWGRLCNSKRMYLGDDDNRKDLESVVPQLAASFFQSRITPWDTVDLDDELTESVLAQADAFPPLVLIDTRTTLTMIHAAMQQVGPAVLSTPSSLGWLLYLTGSIVRNVFQSVEDTLSEPCSYVLLFAVECVNRRRQDASDHCSAFHDFVEGAMIHFLSSVQLVLTSTRVSQAVTHIITNVFSEKVKLFHFILFAIGHNITRDPTSTSATMCGDAKAIVRQSIDLIGDSCRDVPASIMKELRMELPPVVQLPLAQHHHTFKLRTNLCAALWSLRAGSEATYQTETLVQFLKPIEDLMRQTCEGGFRDPLFVGGWLRDLRGVARSTANQQSCFTDFVDWVIDHTAYFTDVVQGLQGNPSPVVVVSLLRFMAELVTTSRYGKVNLPTCSHCASGIMLFKFLCRMLQDVLAVTITDAQLEQVSRGSIPDGVYRHLLKPLWLSMDVIKKCLHGDFVPFGAMQLYKDDCFEVTVLGIFRMMSVFPFATFRQYTKTSFAVLDLLRSMTELHVISPMSCMSSAELSHAIQFAIYVCSDVDTSTGALLHGLSFLSFIAQLVGTVKVMVTSPASSPADLVTSSSSQGGSTSASSGNKGGGPRSSRRLREAIAQTLAPHTDLWTTLIHTAMSVIVCQDRALSVCCSVVYPIFEADPGFWYQFANEFVTTYPERKQEAVQAALSDLSNAGETQDKFFAEVFVFRNKMRNI